MKEALWERWWCVAFSNVMWHPREVLRKIVRHDFGTQGKLFDWNYKFESHLHKNNSACDQLQRKKRNFKEQTRPTSSHSDHC